MMGTKPAQITSRDPLVPNSELKETFGGTPKLPR